MRFWDEISQRLAGLSSATPEEARQALNEFDTRDIQAVRVSEGGGGGGGGFSPVCVLLRADTVDIHDGGINQAKWSSMFDNPWDVNSLTEIPAGLGLSFAFDGSSSEITTTLAGTWAFTMIAEFAADATWSGRVELDDDLLAYMSCSPAGLGVNPHVTVAETVKYPSGAIFTPSIATDTPATADPLNANVFLNIVRLA